MFDYCRCSNAEEFSFNDAAAGARLGAVVGGLPAAPGVRAPEATQNTAQLILG